MTTRQKKQTAETGCAVCNPALDRGNVVENIVESMRRHWKTGVRTPHFHKLVLDDCPDCVPLEYTQAAEIVWRGMVDNAEAFANNVRCETHGNLADYIPF